MTMVVVSVPAWHLKNRYDERVVMFFLELQNVLASLHVENRDICVSGTIRRTLDNLLGLCMAVLFVTILFVNNLVVTVIVVAIVVILMTTVVLFVSKSSAFEWAIDKQITEVFYQH